VIYENFKILAFKQGQLRSIKNSIAQDSEGNPIPWYTYPAIEYLNSFDFSRCNVFEFGSGNSSLYWALRCRRVVSVEDNQDWYEVVNKKKFANHTLIYRKTEVEYVSALTEQNNNFEIIVIDGNHRLSCSIAALEKLNEEGVIILDNSDRALEKECGQLFRENGFIEIDFSGFGPINGYCWTTSIFLKSAKLFATNFTGPTPIGGLNN
jgi:hypothetical protein